MNPPLFIFKFSDAAASHNAKVLADHDFNLDKIIRHQHPSQISYGSEFRPSAHLEDLLSQHPLWRRLKEILDQGATFSLDEISDFERHKDLVFHSNIGNHKSASKHHQVLREIIKDDVERGFALPLPITALHFLRKASLAPLGCAQQSLLDPSGNKTTKFQMTHDQSFPGPSNLSVNLRVQQIKLPPIMYSFVLLWSIHYILTVHQRHPTTKIFICKFDIDAAYRHCTFSSKTAFESLTIFGNFLLVALRMTFGGSPCPSIWGVIYETITDVGNVLLQNKLWDHNELFDPLSSTLDAPAVLPKSIPFQQTRDLSVEILTNYKGKVDIYIDDSIGIAPELGDAPARVVRAIPLAIRSISWPLSAHDVIPRRHINSLKKLCAEGQLSEVKTVLGWTINTRSLTISLPTHKISDLSHNISSILLSKKVD